MSEVMNILGTASGGMETEIGRTDCQANAGDPEDTVDLGAEAVAMISTRDAVRANAAVVRVGEEMERSALDCSG
jgi:hypothetical protein